MFVTLYRTKKKTGDEKTEPDGSNALSFHLLLSGLWSTQVMLLYGTNPEGTEFALR